MDITDIVGNLQAQVQAGSKIELNSKLLSDSQLQALSIAFGLAADARITVNGVTNVPAAVGDTVTITTGTIDLLQQQQLTNLQLVFRGGPDTNLTFYVPMPASWRVVDSFPRLTLFPFPLLSLSAAGFVYSTEAVAAWPVPGGGQLVLTKGLNFNAQVTLSGLDALVTLLGAQTPAGALNLSGPFSANVANPYPTMQLTADLGIASFTLVPGLDVQGLGLLLQVAEPDDNGEQAFRFGVTAGVASLTFNVLLAAAGNSMRFEVVPLAGTQFTLASLTQTTLVSAVLPGVDFSNLVPSALTSVFQAIAFRRASAVLTLAPTRQVKSIFFTIGQASGSTIDLGLFKLSDFSFRASWINPGTASMQTQLAFSATGKVPLAVFKDNFSFTLAAAQISGHWALTDVTATYTGTISLADIIQEISPTSVLPEFLSQVSFSDFLVSAQPDQQQFTLACMGNVAVNFFNQDFVLGLALIITKTASQTTFQLNAQCLVADLLFTLALTLANSATSSSFSAVGTAQYSGEFDLNFTFALREANKTTTIELGYQSSSSPTLVQVLTLAAERLGLDAAFPGGLDIDATLDALSLVLVKQGTDSLRVDLASLFILTVESKDWPLYLSYTNDTHFEGQEERAHDPKGAPAYALGVALSGSIGLAALPLVGDIPGVADLTIQKLGFYYTNAAFTTKLTKLCFAVAALGTDTTLAPDPAEASLTQPKFSLLALFGSADAPQVLPLPVDSGPATPDVPTFQQKQSPPKEPISWLSLNKTFGPVELIKVGFSYSAPSGEQANAIGIVGLYLTGAFSVGGLSLVLDQLGVTFPIPKPGSGLNPLSEIGFHLGGMFLKYKAPSFEIAGGFINLPGGSVNMIGEFVVQFGNFGLQAYGGYSNQLGSPSLFIFLHLNAPLGGPPFFFINGVSGGFGVNRGFTLPTFDQLTTYPLLPASPAIPTGSDLAGQSQEDKLLTMTNALVGLASYFPVEEGEYWLAAGLDVSSFEMISVSAVLSVAFGVNLQIGVVGSASMTLPVKALEPIAFIQINFEVAYSSSSEMLAVMGVITPSSYIYSGLVHISGGFAFNTWFGGPHAGDFVLTVGGYNSLYTPPSHYPLVPRMEMRAGIGPVNMIGQAYFALLPSMMMAGLDIRATADLGPVAAWFVASLDFSLGWKPFHYEVTAKVEIGASFTIDVGFIKAKITIHVSVFLNVWGPAFGGRATVDLDIISFTIYFGADPQPHQLLGWSEFRDFLPSVKGDAAPAPAQLAVPAGGGGGQVADANPPLVNLLVKAGLVQSFEPGHEVDGLNWIVAANGFDIRTQSTAPITKLRFNGTDLPVTYPYLDPAQLEAAVAGALQAKLTPPYFAYAAPPAAPRWDELAFGIPPMGLTNISSTHLVDLRQLDSQGQPAGAETKVIVLLKTSGVPPSLWGNKPVSATTLMTKDSVLANALVELSIVPMVWFPKRTTFIAYYYLVFDTNNLFLEQTVAPVLKEPDFTPTQTQAIYQQMQDGTAFSATQPARAALVSALSGLGFDRLQLVNSEQLSTQDYVEDPALIYMSSLAELSLN